MSKKIAILGSTGSIGRRALEVIEDLGESFEVVGLTAHRNVDRLVEQCKTFRPRALAIGEEKEYPALKKELGTADCEIYAGLEGIVRIATLPEVDIVLNALVGSVGLLPTLEALRCGKRVALANKVALVLGGGTGNGSGPGA
jgi:1-deoxy-D-xylulose-5-phosphate reductoisomerase